MGFTPSGKAESVRGQGNEEHAWERAEPEAGDEESHDGGCDPRRLSRRPTCVFFRMTIHSGMLLGVAAVVAPCALSALAMSDEAVLTTPDVLSLPPETRQLVIVTAPAGRSVTGFLQRWERPPEALSWRPEGPAHPVSLGRAGLAWGVGLHASPEGAARKQEGDGKAPAGIFRLGTAFGYAPGAVPGSRWPYRQATDSDLFVDDPGSPDYNRWVTSDCGAAESRWASFERMRREDGLYRHGLVVEHNSSPPVPGCGSAIFLHIWKGPGEPTSGCTAMAEGDLIALLEWLRPEDHPLFVQVAEPDFACLRIKW